MRKLSVARKNRWPAMVSGSFMLLAAVFVGLVIKNQFYASSNQPAQGNEQKEKQTSVVRGEGRRNIYDRNFMELAVSYQRSSLYARPLELEAPEKVAKEVAEVLGVAEKNILSALKGERSFAWLGRDLPREKAVKIADLNLKGVYLINQVRRFYPGNQLAAHVIGFLKDEQGLAGVESYYDSILRGAGAYDPRLAAAGVSKKIAEGSDSASLILTLDVHLQNILEQKLKGLVESTQAKSGVAVLMAPDTGEIIALVSLPNYDPNYFWQFNDEARKNRAIENFIYLGAMDRLFQTAAVMDKGAGLEKAELQGAESAPEPEAIQKALWNVVRDDRYISAEGLALGQAEIGHSEFNAFADRIGLTVKGEVDLPEALFALKHANIAPVNNPAGDPGKNPPAQVRAMIPQTDQGFVATATPLAVLSAFCRLINGGQMMTPHVLRAVWQNEQVWAVPAQQGIGEFIVRPEVRAGMRSEMKKAVGAGRDNFIIETLYKAELSSVPAQTDKRTGETSSLIPLGRKKTLAPQIQARSAGKSENLPGKDGGEKAVQEQLKMESILLGMAPLEHPEIAMIVVLDGAHFDLLARSPVRNIAEEMMPQARTAMQKQIKPPSAWEVAVREIGYYKKLEMQQGKSSMSVTVAQGPQSFVMPDVRGLSGRKAVQTLQQYGLRLKISGSGQVVSQSPVAGTALRGVEPCVLHLKTMQ